MINSEDKEPLEHFGKTDYDRFMRFNIAKFLSNITFDDRYSQCVLEFQKNQDRYKIFNLLKEVWNNPKNQTYK